MGETSRNQALSFEEMADTLQEDEVVVNKPKEEKKKKLNFFQSLLAWWSK